MKSLFTCVLLTLMMGLVFAQESIQVADFDGPGRFGAVTFVVDGIAYAGLGETGFEQYPQKFYRFNEKSQDWTEIADFPGDGREYAVGFALDGVGYVGLGFSISGFDLTNFRDFYRYDPGSDEWTKLHDFGGEGRVKAVAFVVDSVAYAGLGSSSGSFFGDFWKYDPQADSWSEVSAMALTPMHDASVAVVHDKAYLLGGRGAGGVFNEKIMEFDPADGSWVEKLTIPGLTIEGAAAFALGNKIYFGYGGQSTQLFDYDPLANTSGSFGTLPGLASIDRGPVAFATDSLRAYFGLGYTSVIANQPVNYNKRFWKVESIITTGIVTMRSDQLLVARFGADAFQIQEKQGYVYDIQIYSASGQFVASWYRHPAYCDFVIPGPSGIYVLTTRDSKSAVTSQLLFK